MLLYWFYGSCSECICLSPTYLCLDTDIPEACCRHITGMSAMYEEPYLWLLKASVNELDNSCLESKKDKILRLLCNLKYKCSSNTIS